MSMSALRQELLSFEEKVPWGAVVATWRTQRGQWRKAVKSSETVPEVAFHVLSLKAEMVMFLGPGANHMPPWERTLRLCCHPGTAVTHQQLARAWHEFRAVANEHMFKVSLHARGRRESGDGRGTGAGRGTE